MFSIFRKKKPKLDLEDGLSIRGGYFWGLEEYLPGGWVIAPDPDCVYSLRGELRIRGVAVAHGSWYHPYFTPEVDEEMAEQINAVIRKARAEKGAAEEKERQNQQQIVRDALATTVASGV